MNRARLVRLIGRWLLVMPERTTPRPSERATLRQAVGPRNGGSRLFSVAPSRALYIAKQNSRPAILRCALAASLGSTVQALGARRLFVATKAAMGAADLARKLP